MYIVVDFNSDEAIYMQVRNQIIMGIANDEIREGDTLPSVRQLAEEIGINMHTVNKAYSVLKQEGFLKLDRRRGAVISLELDRLVAIRELTDAMRVVIARALCKNISREEMHNILDMVLDGFERNI